jgi:ribonuclease HII
MKELDSIYNDGWVGIDEAGRGCSGGSLFFVGAKLKPGVDISQIAFANDSKKTSHNQRVSMAKRLRELVQVCIVQSSAERVDEIGLSKCISTSLEKIKETFGDVKYVYDGNTSYKVPDIETVVKGDAKVSLISAASIFAKLRKDVESLRIHQEYPEYGFDTHSGYINEKHTNMIIQYGYTKYHRKSYNIKKLSGLNIPQR